MAGGKTAAQAAAAAGEVKEGDLTARAQTDTSPPLLYNRHCPDWCTRGHIITTKSYFLREYILPPNAARDSAPQGRYAVAVFLQRAQSHHNWRLTKGSVRVKVRNPAPRTRARAAS